MSVYSSSSGIGRPRFFSGENGGVANWPSRWCGLRVDVEGVDISGFEVGWGYGDEYRSSRRPDTVGVMGEPARKAGKL